MISTLTVLELIHIQLFARTFRTLKLLKSKIGSICSFSICEHSVWHSKKLFPYKLCSITFYQSGNSGYQMITSYWELVVKFVVRHDVAEECECDMENLFLHPWGSPCLLIPVWFPPRDILARLAACVPCCVSVSPDCTCLQLILSVGVVARKLSRNFVVLSVISLLWFVGESRWVLPCTCTKCHPITSARMWFIAPETECLKVKMKFCNFLSSMHHLQPMRCHAVVFTTWQVILGPDENIIDSWWKVGRENGEIDLISLHPFPLHPATRP